MDKNIKDPNKPRLWVENIREEDRRNAYTDQITPFPPAVNTSEEAVRMMNDPDTREELLKSLKGRQKPK